MSKKNPLQLVYWVRHIAQRHALTVGLVAIAFCIGFMARGGTPADAQDGDFALIKQVQGLLAQHFVRELPDSRQMEYAAIRGYLSTLNDPYTFFNDPPVTSSESDALAGRYGGIGVVIERNEAGFIVLYPYPDSPATRAGVLDGDLLIAVNGAPIDPAERLDVIRQMTRGEIKEGAGVQITVRQPSATENRTYDILFDEIRVPSILWRVLEEDPAIGYIKISSFTALTPEEFSQSIIELRTRNVQALVLDLRDNPGGLLQESKLIAGEFLDGGNLLIEESRANGRIEFPDEPGGLATDLPLVVLTNQGTASAAEVVAGALKDNQRALVIGQRTLGKGSVQFIFRLDDGSSVHITSSIWYTSVGTPIDGVGLVPDIEMIPDVNNRDVELGEAIRQLQAQMASS